MRKNVSLSSLVCNLVISEKIIHFIIRIEIVVKVFLIKSLIFFWRHTAKVNIERERESKKTKYIRFIREVAKLDYYCDYYGQTYTDTRLSVLENIIFTLFVLLYCTALFDDLCSPVI